MVYKRIGITVKSGLDHKDEAVAAVIRILKECGATLCIDAQRSEDLTCVDTIEKMQKICDLDLLVVIGGDGTILRAVREMDDFSIPILSVNRGAVGFMAETSFDEVEELLPKLVSGEGVIEERAVLHVRAERNGETIFSGVALNEAVIAQGTIARLVDLDTNVNGEPLTRYHADGLIISTPTGSTAYNLAAGGPVVHPSISAAILTPINPHSFSQKPIVIPGSADISVRVDTKPNKFQDTKVVLTIDGQVYVPLQKDDVITAHVNDTTVKFLRRAQDTFFSTIRTKLKWGERVD